MVAHFHCSGPLPAQVLIANDGTGWRLLAAGSPDDCTDALRRLRQEPAPRRSRFLIFGDVIGQGERFSDSEVARNRGAGLDGESDNA